MISATVTKPWEDDAARADLLRVRRMTTWAGFCAGLASWLIGEAFVGRFTTPAHLIGKLGVSGELMSLSVRAQADDASLAFSVLGGLLGLALGLAGGLSRGSMVAGLAAGGLALVAGSGAGLVASHMLIPGFDQYRLQIADNLLIPLLLHGGIWGSLGAIGGLAFGLARSPRDGVGGVFRALIGGLAGAWLATVAFELIGAILLSTSGTTQPYPATPLARLVCMLTIATVTGRCVAESLRGDGGTGSLQVVLGNELARE